MKFDKVRVRPITEEEALSLTPDKEIFRRYRYNNPKYGNTLFGDGRFPDDFDLECLVRARGGGRKWDERVDEPFDDAIATSSDLAHSMTMTRFRDIFVADPAGEEMDVVRTQTFCVLRVGIPWDRAPGMTDSECAESFRRSLHIQVGGKEISTGDMGISLIGHPEE